MIKFYNTDEEGDVYSNSVECNLLKIFKHYQQLYGFYELYLQFDEHIPCRFMHKEFININFAQAKDLFPLNRIKHRHNCKTLNEFYINILLHEIGHVRDLKLDKMKFNERRAIQKQSFADDIDIDNPDNMEYYFPLEKSADDFARKEIKKWI